MRIIYSYQSKEGVFDRETAQVDIGRPKEGVVVDLDLTPDEKVSRPHARIWVEDGQHWIEDLNSAHGTRVNGEEIKGKRRLQPGDIIKISETTLIVQIPAEQATPNATLPLEEVTASLDANEPAFNSADARMDTERQLALLSSSNFYELLRDIVNNERRLALFYELPLQFGKETRLDALLQFIVERVVGVIPGAQRGALLVKDRETGRLALKAHLPMGKPAVSMTLAQQAINQLRACIWPPPDTQQAPSSVIQVPRSVSEDKIESAMYAPLLWKGEALGVVCVDNRETCGAFNSDDLRLLQAVAHHAALAVANLQLQEDLRHKAQVLTNLLKLISPQVAERLKQHRGPIRLGGEFCEATILFSDIRGFTKLSAQMEPNDVTDMLEDYFSRLVPIVFEHHGTIDKFVGDAIVAVFGSPRADEKQHRHAIQAAVEMQRAMQEVNDRRSAQGKHTGELGIGVHCGAVVHGFIGARERMEFTVIGDAVNRASRYCDGASRGEVLISPEVYQWVFNIIEAEQTAIATKHEGDLTAYRIKCIRA